MLVEDATENARREMVKEINKEPGSREWLEAKHGRVWDTQQMQEEFDAIGFAAPLLVCVRKSDRVKGSLMFQHSPRFYFSFSEHG